MIELSHRTGGLFVSDSNDMGNMLRRAVDDGDGYYLIGYQPHELTFDDASGNAVFHKISLRVKRPGLKVRSRAGFYGRPDNSPAPQTSQTRRLQLASALASPFANEDIGVRLTGLVFPSTEGTSIKALLHFDAKDLNFTEQPDGVRAAEVDIATVAFDAEGQQLSTEGTTSRIRVPANAFEEVLRNGLVYATQVNVQKAGGYELRVVLRDSSNMHLGSAMQFVDVPDVRNGRLALSGIVLAAIRSPSQVTAEGNLPETQNEGTPALRVFRPGSAFAYTYHILNARTDDTRQPQLEEQIRIFRDGQQVVEGKQRTLAPNSKLANPKHLAVNGSVRLHALPPGNYVLQVVVADNNRYDKYRITTQAIDFEVQP
jgi:hypothetical protein